MVRRGKQLNPDLAKEQMAYNVTVMISSDQSTTLSKTSKRKRKSPGRYNDLINVDKINWNEL